MSLHSYDDLLRAVGRGELAPVYYLSGSEDILKDEAVRAIIDRALEPHERDFNLDQRGAQGLDPETLHALINTLPMMANRRVVVIRDIEQWKKKTSARDVVLTYLGNPSADTILVLVEGAPNEEKERGWQPDPELANRCFATECKRLEPDRVVKWLRWHARRLGITFADGAAEHLASATLHELGTLRAELEKLAGLESAEPITRDRIGELVGVRAGETLEDWVEALLADDTAKAVTLTPGLLGQAGMTGVKMVTALGTNLVGLKLARALHEKGTRGAALERALFDRFRIIRPFGVGDWKVVIRQWSRYAATWSASRLRDAVRSTLEADQALKGTRLSDDDGVLLDLAMTLGATSTRRQVATGSEGERPRQSTMETGVMP